MIPLVEKLGRSLKFPHRLDKNHLTNESEEALSASFHAFRADLSRSLSQILLEAKPGSSEFWSLAGVERCLEALPTIDKAFAKPMVDIDYPISKWEAAVCEAYLKYSLNVLELLNKISSSLSHLNQARLSLSHGLSMIRNLPYLALKHLQKIQPKEDLAKDFKVEAIKEKKEKFQFFQGIYIS